MAAICMAALLLAATPSDGSSSDYPASPSVRRNAQDLRREVSEQLRREARSEGAENETAVRALVELHHALQQDRTLAASERTRLTGKIRSRLLRVSRRLSTADDPRASAGQALAASGAGGGRAADDHGPELVELIQTVIAPQSWDINGGPGAIYYYRPLRALVIRQTDEVHGQIGDVLGQMRP